MNPIAMRMTGQPTHEPSLRLGRPWPGGVGAGVGPAPGAQAAESMGAPGAGLTGAPGLALGGEPQLVID